MNLENGARMIEFPCRFINVAPVIDRRCEIIYHLHHSHCVFAQVEMLLRTLIDIPFKLVKMNISLSLLEYFKEEVETNLAFTNCFCILIAFKLHNFKVEIF